MRTLAVANGLIERLLDALEKHHSEDKGYQCETCGMEWKQYPMHLPCYSKDHVYIAGSRRHGWLPKNEPEPTPCNKRLESKQIQPFDDCPQCGRAMWIDHSWYSDCAAVVHSCGCKVTPEQREFIIEKARKIVPIPVSGEPPCK